MSNAQHDQRLLKDPILPLILRLGFPIFLGITSTFLFNLADIYFISRLGERELVAVSFTFPITFFVIYVAIGLSNASTSMISPLIGKEGLKLEVRQVATINLFFSLLAGIFFTLLGILTFSPLFDFLGASEELKNLCYPFLFLWYLALPLSFGYMMIGSALRAGGDTKTPSLLMILTSLLNLLFAPLLIFGLGPLPSFGFFGAGLSAILSFGIIFSISVYLFRCANFFTWNLPSKLIPKVGKKLFILSVGNSLSNIFLPLSSGIVLSFVSSFGDHTIAGFGIGLRLEPLFLVPIMAIAATTLPLVGQNLGGNQIERVKTIVKTCLKLSFLIELGMCLISLFFSTRLASLFTKQPETIQVVETFLWIVPLSWGILGWTSIINATFSAYQKPHVGLILNFIGHIGLTLPFVFFGGKILGISGVFFGKLLANLLSGLISSTYFYQRIYKGLRHSDFETLDKMRSFSV